MVPACGATLDREREARRDTTASSRSAHCRQRRGSDRSSPDQTREEDRCDQSALLMVMFIDGVQTLPSSERSWSADICLPSSLKRPVQRTLGPCQCQVPSLKLNSSLITFPWLSKKCVR